MRVSVSAVVRRIEKLDNLVKEWWTTRPSLDSIIAHLHRNDVTT